MGLRVVVPFTSLAPAVWRALDATGADWEPADVSGDDEAYWRLLAGLWAAGAGFIVCEHDVIVLPDTFDRLEACPSDWCAFAHRYLGGAHYGLGCCKFSASLTRRVPDALDRVAAISDAAHPAKHWCRLDGWLATRVLPAAGAVMCQHQPVLDHPTGRSSHGCI